MACALVYRTKRNLTNDTMSGNPNKKLRLDFQNKADGSTGNDDLWGPDDLTADEFDMLEVQATQSCNQSISHSNRNSEQMNRINFAGYNNTTQVDDLKQLQYELEGRVKLLSQSLEKSTKELSEERINKEKIINDRLRVFQQKESELQKNIGKLQSILEFKEQEMKNMHSKLQVLKAQTQDKKNCTDTSINKNFEDFFVSSKPFHSKSESCEMLSTKKFHRKHKLSVDSPRGQIESVDIFSSVICNRLSTPSYSSSENLTNCAFKADTLNGLSFTPMSIVQLKSQQNSNELLEYYKCFLKSHVISLKTTDSRSTAGISTKISPLSARRNSVSSKTITSCLRDVMNILPLMKFDYYGCNGGEGSTTFNMEQPHKEGGSSSPNPCHLENKINLERVVTIDVLSSILDSLLTLANPKTYPNGYPQTEEIELSLSSLFNIALICPKIYLESTSELPIYALISYNQSVTSVSLTLKLITSLSASQSFASHLIHKDSGCLLCSINTFMCSTLHLSPEKYAVSMLLIEDFLSSVLSIHTVVLNQLGTAHCITETLKGVITSIWKYFHLKGHSNCHMLIIKKGFLLLHFMSSCLANFKESRSQVEEEYISLLSSYLTISKENSEFREYYDLIHNLWDFQTDVSEFDLEEASDETRSSNNDMVIDSN